MENKIKKLSPMVIQFWINKGLTEDEAIYKIKTFRKLNKEYWTSRGYNEDDAILKVKEFQQKQGNIAGKNRKENPEKYKDRFSTSLEYWIKRTNTIEEAIDKYKDRQTTFSLEKCINKYGQIIGEQKWKERQEKWQNNLNNKSDEEKQRINKLKDGSSIDFFLKKGYSIEEAKKLYKISCKKKVCPTTLGHSSKESLKIFEPLYYLLIEKYNVKVNDIYIGFKFSKEFYICTDERYYFYDFTIISKKIIIEYNGSKFHSPPNLNEEEKTRWKSLYNNISYNKVLEFDNKKIKIAEDNGFKVFIIWDYYTKEQIKNILFNIINLIIE